MSRLHFRRDWHIALARASGCAKADPYSAPTETSAAMSRVSSQFHCSTWIYPHNVGSPAFASGSRHSLSFESLSAWR
ncbi:MAG TPA: hypothetical protein VKU38_02480, partial [Ktedonobacteraceae bacterium]|nr:hypothetical protein [Ktedonobacteraceae bacterium]